MEGHGHTVQQGSTAVRMLAVMTAPRWLALGAGLGGCLLAVQETPRAQGGASVRGRITIGIPVTTRRPANTYSRGAQRIALAPVSELHNVIVYLKEGTVKSSTPDAALLDGARETIRASIADMRALLADSARNIARKEDFAMTPDRRACRSCFFRELCFPDGLK